MKNSLETGIKRARSFFSFFQTIDACFYLYVSEKHPENIFQLRRKGGDIGTAYLQMGKYKTEDSAITRHVYTSRKSQGVLIIHSTLAGFKARLIDTSKAPIPATREHQPSRIRYEISSSAGGRY